MADAGEESPISAASFFSDDIFFVLAFPTKNAD
jgi:hypothetical protein